MNIYECVCICSDYSQHLCETDDKLILIEHPENRIDVLTKQCIP